MYLALSTLLFTPTIPPLVADVTVRLTYDLTLGVPVHYVDCSVGRSVDFLGGKDWGFTATANVAIDVWMWTFVTISFDDCPAGDLSVVGDGRLSRMQRGT